MASQVEVVAETTMILSPLVLTKSTKINPYPPQSLEKTLESVAIPTAVRNYQKTRREGEGEPREKVAGLELTVSEALRLPQIQ